MAPARGGALYAMMLDVKGTFDALVQRHTQDAAARDRILKNRFYQHVSAALAGSHEYMAMEKLLELTKDDRFDLIVLDTPPTRHALDFLEAPDRLLGFLDVSVLRFFLRPYFRAGRLTVQVATRTGAALLKIADRFLGLQFLSELSEFFLAFEGMYDGFRARAAEVQALLRSPSTGFVLVAGPAGAGARGSALLPPAPAGEEDVLRGVRGEPRAHGSRTRAPRPRRLPGAARSRARARSSPRRCASSRCWHGSSARRSRGSRSTRASGRCWCPSWSRTSTTCAGCWRSPSSSSLEAAKRRARQEPSR